MIMSFIIDTGFEQLYHSSFSKQIQLNPVLTRPLFLHFNSPSRTYQVDIKTHWGNLNQPVRAHFCLPIKRGLLSTVKGILQLFDQVGLSWQPEKALFLKTPLPNEIHALLYQHRGELVPKPAFIPHGLFQLLTKDPWNRHTQKVC